MEKEAFFATAALMIGPPPIDRRSVTWGTMVGSKAAGGSGNTGFARFGFGMQLLTLWERMGRPGVDTNWIKLASHPITSNERKTLSEVIYKEYETWYETEQKIRAAAEAI